MSITMFTTVVREKPEGTPPGELGKINPEKSKYYLVYELLLQ